MLKDMENRWFLSQKWRLPSKQATSNDDLSVGNNLRAVQATEPNAACLMVNRRWYSIRLRSCTDWLEKRYNLDSFVKYSHPDAIVCPFGRGEGLLISNPKHLALAKACISILAN